MIRKRDAIYTAAVDVTAPWSTLVQAEQVVRKTKSMNFLEE